jgi:hypothetical protein|tara:strand:- start:406 stop:573 length:168 start_codon:yes stop_codon:yes gene_type:complete
MGSLLDHSFPDAPNAYDQALFQRILRDIEMALTKKEFPVEIEGKDNSRALSWFFE